jgi:hypothetical protein
MLVNLNQILAELAIASRKLRSGNTTQGHGAFELNSHIGWNSG